MQEYFIIIYFSLISFIIWGPFSTADTTRNGVPRRPITGICHIVATVILALGNSNSLANYKLFYKFKTRGVSIYLNEHAVLFQLQTSNKMDILRDIYIYINIYMTFAFDIRCLYKKVIRKNDKITDNWNLTRYCISQTKGAVHLQTCLYIFIVWSFWNPQMTRRYRLCSLHYLKRYWFIVIRTLGNILQWSVDRYTINFVDED